SAAVPDGKLEDGLNVLAVEAKRVKEFGFTASEVDRAKQAMLAFYARAYAERDKTESASFAAEYLRNFLIAEPSAGIAYEYELVKMLLPGITANDASAMIKALLGDDSRVVLAVSPQKSGIKIPTEAELQSAMDAANRANVEAWADSGSTRELMLVAPSAGSVVSK